MPIRCGKLKPISPMNTTPRLRATGFSLVELIITITIMVMLAGLIVGGFAYVREKQARSTAELQIALLSRGIDEYRLDMGAYPGTGNSNEYGGDATPAAGDNSQVLYQALFFDGWDYVNENRPSDWPNHRASNIYLSELDPKNNNQGWINPITSANPTANLKIIDPWGNNYRYRVGRLPDGSINPNAMNPDFDLWSMGKDGRTQAGGVYNPSHEDNRDDIRNF